MKNLRSHRIKNIIRNLNSSNSFDTTVTTVTKSYKNADIQGKIFDGQDLSNLDFTSTEINGASFKKAILNYSDFTFTQNTAYGIPPNVDFEESSLINVKFRDASLEKSNFTGANLTGVDFTNALLRYANFTGATLTNVNFTNAKNLSFANFTGANLTGAIFEGAVNIGFNTNFTRANLSNNDFSNKIFRNVNFTGANLTNVNLTGANLTGANLTGANLTGAICKDCIFNEIDFTNIFFSETLKFEKSGGPDGSKSTVNNITQLAIQGGDTVDAIWINNTKYGGDGGSKSQTINVENIVFKEIVYHYDEYRGLPYIIVYLKITTSDNQTIEKGTIRDSSKKQTLKNVRLDGIEVKYGLYLDRSNFILKK